LSSLYETLVDPDEENNAHVHVLSFVGYHKSVLDVGCSTGFITKILVERGCDVIGIEVDPEAAKVAERWAERVVVGNIDDGEVWNYVKDESFDVVLLGDVLEHLRDPLLSLREAVRKVKPSGFVVTSLPNVAHGDMRMSLMQGRFRYADTGLLDRTHTKFFTLESARELLTQAGLLVVDTKRVVVPLFTSEIGVNREDVSQETVDVLLKDPEVETYQFVMKSVRDNADRAVAELSQRVNQLSDYVQRETIRTALLRSALRDSTGAAPGRFAKTEGSWRSRFAGLVEATPEPTATVLEHPDGRPLSTREHLLEQQRYIEALEGHVSGLEHNIEVLDNALTACEAQRAAVDANYQAVLRMRTHQMTAPIRWVYNKLIQASKKST
jgi:2-polyprenyl-3-methyl-5-hydroxy-6-metoxy-1,4-benzoquinol methylase